MARAGASVLFLPASSPDFNPIEKMWREVKQSMSSAEARTRETLLAVMASALAAVVPLRR